MENTLPVVGAIIGILLVVVLVFVILQQKRKRKGAEQMPGSGKTVSEPTNEAVPASDVVEKVQKSDTQDDEEERHGTNTETPPVTEDTHTIVEDRRMENPLKRPSIKPVANRSLPVAAIRKPDLLQ